MHTRVRVRGHREVRRTMRRTHASIGCSLLRAGRGRARQRAGATRHAARATCVRVCVRARVPGCKAPPSALPGYSLRAW